MLAAALAQSARVARQAHGKSSDKVTAVATVSMYHNNTLQIPKSNNGIKGIVDINNGMYQCSANAYVQQ